MFIGLTFSESQAYESSTNVILRISIYLFTTRATYTRSRAGRISEFRFFDESLLVEVYAGLAHVHTKVGAGIVRHVWLKLYKITNFIGLSYTGR